MYVRHYIYMCVCIGMICLCHTMEVYQKCVRHHISNDSYWIIFLVIVWICMNIIS